MATGDLQFLATTHAPRCQFTVNKHIPDYYTMQYMESGSIVLAYNGVEKILSGGWFWTAYPGPHIRFHVAPGVESWFHRHIGFRGTLMQEWMAAGLWFHDAQPEPPGTNWGEFFDELIAESRRGDRWGNLRTTNRLENLLIRLAEARAQAEPMHNPWLQAVLAELVRDDVFVPCYSEIARAVGMAESTLRRRFKSATGVSPQEYVLQTRLTRARNLLSDTNLPLKAIAERLGYETLPFFQRQFKERTGMTPGAFRRSRQM